MKQRMKITEDIKDKLREYLFQSPRLSGREIAEKVGVSEFIVSNYKIKWGLSTVKRKKRGPYKPRKTAEGTRVIKGTDFMSKNNEEATVLVSLQKTYNHLSIVEKAVFLSDVEKFIQKEKAAINNLSL
jgi:transposase